MTRLSRVLYNWVKKGDNELLAFFRMVLLAMTDNANFVTPTPALAVLQAAVKVYSDNTDAAGKGTSTEKALRNQSRAAAIALFRELCRYVELDSKNDRAKMLSSGLPISAETRKPFELAKPVVKLVDGQNDGQMEASTKGNSNMVNFYLTTTPDDATSWKLVENKAGKAYLNDLQSGVRYYVQAEALGTRGQRRLSDIVSRVAQ